MAMGRLFSSNKDPGDGTGHLRCNALALPPHCGRTAVAIFLMEFANTLTYMIMVSAITDGDRGDVVCIIIMVMGITDGDGGITAGDRGDVVCIMIMVMAITDGLFSSSKDPGNGTGQAAGKCR